MNDQSSATNSPDKPPPPPPKQSLLSTGSSSPVLVPTPGSLEERELGDEHAIMDENEQTSKTAALNAKKETPPPALSDAGEKDAKAKLTGKAKDKAKNEKKVKSGKRSKKREGLDNESSSGNSSSEEESSDDEKAKQKRKKKAIARAAEKKKAAKLKAKAKAKKGKKSKKYESSDDLDSSDSETETDSEDEKKKRKRKAKAKAKKKSKKYDSSSSDSSSSTSSSDSDSSEDEKAKRKRSKKKAKKAKVAETSSSSDTEGEAIDEATLMAAAEKLRAEIAALQLHKQQSVSEAAAAALGSQTDATATTTPASTDKKTSVKKGKKNALEFKRVDQVWDSKIRDYKYTESVEEQKDEFDGVFTVRRRFGWDNKYIETQVDIKSKLLRNALQVIFKDCKSISLVEDKPSIQPNMLYHYHKEIAAYIKKTLKPQLRCTKKRKAKKQLEQQIGQCKLLLRYIDEDYAETRETLKPMLKAGTITYNLVWALFKPNTIAYTPTYGNKDDPRCFKVDYCYEEEDWFGNKKWSIEGRYLEYDGKVFGLGDYFTQIAAFKGPRKITNLGAYPLAFHKEPEALREQLIERGKKFVALQGMNYRFQKGLAYMKVKRTVMKFNINGRVMIDPALFRRMNANYPLSYIKADELGQDDEDSDDDSDAEGCGCGGSDSDADADDEGDKPGRVVMWKDKAGKKYMIRLPALDKGADITSQKLDTVAEADDPEHDSIKHVFTEEELLIASPVVLGFSFSEKAWVEFSLSGIKEIEWNDEAFSTLVLPQQIKQNLKGLVSSHRFDAAKTIDDVIVGKGKGLNVVLHGPPGVGKTLTGESIAEYLRCPLYAVSSGELGTSASQLERDLNRIMDITHSWGAILLLDEADVFLEARQPHDIHRNALVSVFLRLTEYYQGILFLTTNRVSTFDEAFQSRIHMGIRYENLTMKARKKIWQHHVGKVVAMCESGLVDHKAEAFKEEQYEELSKKVMNGRQIKNAVKTSQAIAVAEKGVFSMDYVKRVMDAHESFEEDMKGGRGYRDAMRQYT
ncbi:hypothetical protein CC80DRAFT_253510 [Byssothecium circinans]|uniref:AAA+ ATPase domain-containing protein n=1 Tax=Byssothecium circinans TaxID=147558 RepID=A0A6A5TAD7_9PLEO|nr:hypothetical protein CC80DRAFT_253510 [Byssothecium circinans]